MRAEIRDSGFKKAEESRRPRFSESRIPNPESPPGPKQGPQRRTDALLQGLSIQPHRPGLCTAADSVSLRAPASGARSSAVEHYLDMVGVTGSIPVAPTNNRRKRRIARRSETAIRLFRFRPGRPRHPGQILQSQFDRSRSSNEHDHHDANFCPLIEPTRSELENKRRFGAFFIACHAGLVAGNSGVPSHDQHHPAGR